MKILLVNKFLYPKGGDAISTCATGKLLKERGHEVIYFGMEHPLNPIYSTSQYFVSYLDLNKQKNIWQQFQIAGKILYSFEAKTKIEKLIKKEKPDIAHLHNFAHQISPSILDVLRKYNIPTVMTMHDYKLVCAFSAMFADGKPCERCKNHKYYWGLLKKCQKDSYIKSLLNAIEMYFHHKILNIYDKIDIFIAASEFIKGKIKEMGFNKKIAVLPHFIELSDYIPEYNYKNEICYFGRLSFKKGINTLIKALKGLNVELKIIGTGPLMENLKLKVENEKISNIRFLGYKTGNELKNEIKKAMAVVVPSEWYEVFGLVVIEAFSLGKPVIGARIGAIPELIEDGETGYLFEPGNVVDLRKKILSFIDNKDKIPIMGKRARKFVEENFNSEKHYHGLMEIYSEAIRKYE